MDKQHITRIHQTVFQLAIRIINIWDKCEKECTVKESLPVKYGAVSLFQMKLLEVGGEAIVSCHDLLNEDFPLELYDFAKNLLETDGDGFPSELWLNCANKICFNYETLHAFDQTRAEDSVEFLKNMKAFHDIENYPDNDLFHALKKIGHAEMLSTYVWYSEFHEVFPFKVLMSLTRDFWNGEKNNWGFFGDDLPVLACFVCLYIALKNEIAIIEEDDGIWGVDVSSIKAKNAEGKDGKKKGSHNFSSTSVQLMEEMAGCKDSKTLDEYKAVLLKCYEIKRAMEKGGKKGNPHVALLWKELDEMLWRFDRDNSADDVVGHKVKAEQKQDNVGVATDKEQKKKAEKQEETTLEQKKKKSMPTITEREQKYFDEAAKEGLLEKVGPNKYKCLYPRPKSLIVYFFIKAYEPASPPYKELEAMFGMTGLSKCAEGLKKRQWYIDELKRERKMERFRNEVLKEPPEWVNGLRLFFENLEKDDE